MNEHVKVVLWLLGGLFAMPIVMALLFKWIEITFTMAGMI
jgi:hypothetical protein